MPAAIKGESAFVAQGVIDGPHNSVLSARSVANQPGYKYMESTSMSQAA